MFIHPSDDCEDISLHARKKLIDTVNFEKIVKKKKRKRKSRETAEGTRLSAGHDRVDLA